VIDLRQPREVVGIVGVQRVAAGAAFEREQPGPVTGGEHDLLGILNDRTADGKDVSWVWDADFEVLAPRVRRATCSGTRAAELALRLKYAGVPPDRIAVQPALDRALDEAAASGEGRLVALPTYTAMLELRALLTRRGVTRGSFVR